MEIGNIIYGTYLNLTYRIIYVGGSDEDTRYYAG